MSGDVQPRKRKDKKKKKDELGVEEHHHARGTAAVFGEGDIFLHSPDEHGTGGHWCAKIIFFSLLAVLITLIGLIIMENRGLSELEANSIESRYAGVLEGWLEDGIDDDHHDVHTLELKHHEEDLGTHPHLDDVDSEEQDTGFEDDGDELEEDDEYHGSEENEDDDDNIDEDGEDNNEEDEEENDQSFEENDQDLEDNDDDEENDQSVEEDDDEENDQDVEENAQSVEDNNDNDFLEDEDQGNNDSYENTNDDKANDENDDEDDEEEDHEDDNEDEDVEMEHIEREASDEDAISMDLPPLPEPDDDDDADSQDDNEDKDGDDDDDDANDGDDDDDDNGDDDDDFLDHEPPVIERITAPAGKPFVEVDADDDVSAEPPVDSLLEEEQYERKQEELRKQEEEASTLHTWLKIIVGGALLAATHAVLRRATGTRDEPEEEDATREETPTIPDRRMTLIEQRAAAPSPVQERPQERIVQEVAKQIPAIIKSAPTPQHMSIEEEEDENELEEDDTTEQPNAANNELYSDEEEIEEEPVQIKKEAPKQAAPVKQESLVEESTPPEEEEVETDPDDVEIIDDEQIEEEVAEEDDEEEISDVDDAELLNRLEAKYGRLPDVEPQPERPRRSKDGGNSAEEWQEQLQDPFWREELDRAEEELRQVNRTCEGLARDHIQDTSDLQSSEAAERASSPSLAISARARYVVAKAYDALAEARRDNKILTRAINAYLELLKMSDRIRDDKLLEITARAINRMHFRGTYLTTEPVHKLLIRRFPDDPRYRNNLTISYLMANKADLAEEVLKETLARWPKDRVALAHYGFVLKTQHNRLEEAAQYLSKALEGDPKSPANEPRFYYHLGDTYLLLGKFKEAHEVHKRGAALGHFLSAEQRSLYNVDRLKSQPWWKIEDTPYGNLAKKLEESWRVILREGEAAKALYEEEKEGLREKGEWSQLDLFVRGREVPDRCKRAPVTCAIVRSEPSASGCRRGQVKFSLIEAGTHVRPHVGPTNCRLRMHLGLTNTKDTYLRVHSETRQWREGKVFLFDDSFEHEVWHNGTGSRLVLIVDVWHPGLTLRERRDLPAI